MKKADWVETPAPAASFSDLRDKIAVVTGASAGIGKATALLLLENGAKVYGLAREGASSLSSGLNLIECDLSDAAALAAAFQVIARETDHLDYVVNVAGIDPKFAIDDITVDQWDTVVDLNLRAYYFVIKEAMPLLRSGRGRSIVNVSSINYRLGISGRAAYSATKAGILGLTSGLARELGRESIRVNTISPGWIFTERQIAEYFSNADSVRHLTYLEQQQSLKIKITPVDIANHIIFYLSQVSRASTGHNCVVDGGWLLE